MSYEPQIVCDRCGEQEPASCAGSDPEPLPPNGWDVIDCEKVVGGHLCPACVESMQRWWQKSEQDKSSPLRSASVWGIRRNGLKWRGDVLLSFEGQYEAASVHEALLAALWQTEGAYDAATGQIVTCLNPYHRFSHPVALWIPPVDGVDQDAEPFGSDGPWPA